MHLTEGHKSPIPCHDDDDDDIYLINLIKITAWQCVTISISILIQNQTGISTRWNQSERNFHD
jgi:hypothetical protein